MTEVDFVDIHTHSAHAGITSIVSWDLGSEQPPPQATYVSAGIHPWSTETLNTYRAIQLLENLPINAIGEIGLDFSKPIDKARQREILQAQLEVASKRRLPVILHCVKAYNEALRILSQYQLAAVIFHGYIGSSEQTATIIKHGYYISAGERSLESPKTIESLRAAPLDRIFAETDTANTPIESIYGMIADIKGLDINTLKRLIYNNFKTVFGCTTI